MMVGLDFFFFFFFIGKKKAEDGGLKCRWRLCFFFFFSLMKVCRVRFFCFGELGGEVK